MTKKVYRRKLEKDKDSLSKEEQEVKGQYSRERYKNLPENEKQNLTEY